MGRIYLVIHQKLKDTKSSIWQAGPLDLQYLQSLRDL